MNFLTKEQAAKFLEIAPSTLTKLVQKKKVACYRFPKPTSPPKFIEKDLIAFISTHRIEARCRKPNLRGVA